MSDKVFDNILELPNSQIKEKAETLVGFEQKFNRIHNNLRLLLDKEGLESWRQKFHMGSLPAVDYLVDKYPLIIFEGDVGTGKTASAEALADRMTRELGKQGFFLRLSTRVRGEGLHGEMGNLVNDAFAELITQAGKRRLAFLLIDEADAIATTRSTHQMHQEEKAGVNTLIQKIDEIRSLNGRAIVIMSTNRLHFLDEAIIRRAAIVVKFERPTDDERKELIEKDLDGADLSTEEIKSIVELTGPNENEGIGFSFSDLRLRLFPESIAAAFPSSPLNYDIVRETLNHIKPSPVIK
ncbi:ATPase family protein associated with various cellular activities (AAA) [Roseivirga ehrenbergii]|uniref:AAA family ATPase n=1 Tax=Roseivirga ehrenbergii (strain DSM 102268 / JCM 13514 / KCTC 12282 / NCIMB 14502 / KMM 6017) TaxID=279360 RepID=A0A150X7Z3_ROSEK|nr:ATP-binding protein [Roseivirga ehrenbergii]KYG74849.1 AAA family ATPase [Roseivirga ehrenbergii]TCL13815.1 ATPase family protein associated with various cellular activities (AAA) [Roseivirga ehrenbergii]